MDIIKHTKEYTISRIWLGIPASYELDCEDIYNIKKNHYTQNIVYSFVSKYPNRGWAYIQKCLN